SRPPRDHPPRHSFPTRRSSDLVLSQRWGLPWLSEQEVLDLAPGQQVLIREVALICRGEPWVQARTLIPVATLNGPQRRLRNLGRSEEHTSELQSRENLVCRLLL